MFNSRGAFTDPQGYAGESADLFRAVYLTPDASDIKQTLSVSDTPEVIQFNGVQIESDHVSLDILTGEFTFNKDEGDVLLVSIEVLREDTGGSLDWAFFGETSIDDGATWVPLDGSTRRKSIPSQDANQTDIIQFDSVIKSTKGLKFRLKHVTTDASKTVSIISKAASGGAPSSAGVILSLYSKT